MTQSRIFKSLLGLTIIMCLFSSCGWGSKRKSPKGKNIICLVDFSDSKNASERLLFYMNVIKDNVIPNLSLYDQITVLPIDIASITNSSDILLNDLSKINFEPDLASPIEEAQLINDSLNRYKAILKKEFTNCFKMAIERRNKSNNGTDIFGALEVVKSKLKTTEENYLIILSDMMNYSNTLIMEPSNIGFNLSTLEQILKKVPNFEMPNTTVLVLTAEQVEVTPDHYKLVQLFWTKYFDKNHIKIYDYNSASVSKLIEMMALPVTE